MHADNIQTHLVAMFVDGTTVAITIGGRRRMMH